MKRLLAMILAVALMLTLAACGNKDNEEPTPTSEPTESVMPTEEVLEMTEEATATPKTTAAPKATAVPATAEPAPKTVGAQMKSAFRTAVASTTDPVALAEKLAANPMIQFMPMSMAVEPGYLNGFDNEITGFKSGATFGPMIGTIPFVGYVFSVDGDVEGFKTTLKNNANLRWNICTSADEMIVDSVGNTVFFLMCPTTFEE